MQVKIKFIYQGILFMRCVFLAVPGTYIKPFPFAKGSMVEVPASSYTWILLELASFFIVMVMFYRSSIGKLKMTKDRVKSTFVFVVMCGFDLFDFIIRGNSEWFMVGNYPFTNNILMCVFYFIFTYSLEESSKHDIG